MTSDSSPLGPPALGEVSPPAPGTDSVFRGPNGIRAGWRLLIAIVIFLPLNAGLSAASIRIPGFHEWVRSHKDSMTPGVVLLGEGSSVLALIISAFIISLIEKRSFADYGLPLNEAFGKRFWQGFPYGFAMLSLLMASIAALHGFSLGGLALRGDVAVWYAFLYLLAFILVGIFEEFSFRGYLQATLGSGIGFWPAAIVLAIGFGAIHLQNSGEAVFGALMAACFGLLTAFSLWRTGNLWFAIGVHAAWDWGETYFYSVPDSGLTANGHLLNSSLHGPAWIAGGTVGPEGSIFVPIVLALSAVGIHYIFPSTRTER